MAAIQNDRDVLLQAAPVRVLPVGQIQIGDVAGLPEALAAASQDVGITASATEFTGSTPTSITLTVQRKNGLMGSVVWTLMSGSAALAPSGDDCVITNTSMSVGGSASIRARVISGSTNHDAFITISKLGALAGQNNVTVETLTGTLLSGKNIHGSEQVYIGGGTSLSPISLRGSGGLGPGPYPYTGDARIYGYASISYSGTAGFFEVGADGIKMRNPSTGGIKIGDFAPQVGEVSIIGNPLNITGAAITIDGIDFIGTLGSRVIVKGNTYNVEVNGVPGTTVKFL